MPEPSPSPHRWNQIKRLPLHPQIKTLAQYEESIIKGTSDAIEFLETVDVFDQLTVTDLQVVHYHIFQRAHPWAGQFRAAGNLAVVAGFPAADSSRIPRELELGLHQTRQLLVSAAGNTLHQLAAIVFLHVRFERIHPFLDGNGRSGRSVLAIQFERVFGHLPDFSDQRGYRDAIRASSSGDLGPFLRYLGPSAGVNIPPGKWPSVYRLAPRFLEASDGDPSFEDDLRWSTLPRS